LELNCSHGTGRAINILMTREEGRGKGPSERRTDEGSARENAHLQFRPRYANSRCSWDEARGIKGCTYGLGDLTNSDSPVREDFDENRFSFNP